jgi:hypothetical protein
MIRFHVTTELEFTYYFAQNCNQQTCRSILWKKQEKQLCTASRTYESCAYNNFLEFLVTTFLQTTTTLLKGAYYYMENVYAILNILLYLTIANYCSSVYNDVKTYVLLLLLSYLFRFFDNQVNYLELSDIKILQKHYPIKVVFILVHAGKRHGS